MRLAVAHYTNATQPFLWARAVSDNGANTLQLGGGDGSFTPASSVAIITSATPGTAGAGTQRWHWSSAGHLLASTDNSYDIGANNATRPRSIYVGTSLVMPKASGADDRHDYFGNQSTSIPSKASLGQNDHVFIQYKQSSSPLAYRHFIHSQTDPSIPENEFAIEAYYHPGFILDNINTGVGHRASIVFRRQGVGEWAIQSDADDNDTYDFIILGNADDPTNGISRLEFARVPTILDTMGVGTVVQTWIRGNTELMGSLQSIAQYNNTTGRAALSLKRTVAAGAEQTWLRNAGVRKLEIASDRDGGDTYFILDSDNLRFNIGPATSAYPMLKRNASGIDVRKGDDSGYERLDASAISLYRSAGNAGQPDLWGDGTNALVIAGKADGSGSVKFGTTTSVNIGTGRALTTSDEVPPTLDTADRGYFFSYTINPPVTAAAATIVGANDQVRAVQFVLPYRVVVRRIAVEVTTAGAAGSKVAVGIYSSDGNTKLVDSGALDAASTGVKTASITAVTLNPGVYWFAQAASDATVQTRTINAVTAATNMLNPNTNKKIGIAANAAAAGVLPSSLGTITGSGINTAIAVFEP
jgi:hypothetical protein